MGNCLVINEKLIRVAKPDGKILEYKPPIRVHQVLSDFSGYAISDSLEFLKHLLPGTKLLGGQLYYLVPLPLRTPQVKKKVRFSVPEKNKEDSDGEKAGRMVRIKMVITKKELQEMLKNGGFSVDDLVMSRAMDQQRVQELDMSCGDDVNKGWKPVLESIPELD